MQAQTVAQVLDIWRDIERLLEQLPEDDSRVPELRVRAADLRRTYQQLTQAADSTSAMLRSSRATIAAAEALLERVREEA